MPGDVLRRNAGGAARKSFVLALQVVGSELSLRMSVEIRAVAIEREHDEEFRIHARRGNSRGSQPLDS